MKRLKNAGPQPGSRIKKSNVKQYICLVDQYRRPSRRRNTCGRYRVGARNPKEARRILQKVIGFGSIQVYYQETGNCGADRAASYGECLQEMFPTKDGKAVTSPAVRFDTPMSKRNS